MQPNLFSPAPVRGRTPRARQRYNEEAQARLCRRLGHEKAGDQRGNLWRRMLKIYAEGGRTDAEMARELGVERTTVTARRDELIKIGKVQDTGTSRVNPRSHVPNTVWGLVG